MITDYWENRLAQAFDTLGYKPVKQWHVNPNADIKGFGMAYMDYSQAEIGLSQRYRLRPEMHEDLLCHEVVHVCQAEEDPERYMRIRQIPGSGGFRRTFHDTLLNPFEVEARLFEKQRILTRLPTAYLLKGSSSPFEWLISNPVQAVRMLQLHPEWGSFQVDKVPPEYEERFLDLNALARSELVPEAIALSSLLEELLSKLRETTPDIGKFLGWA